MVSPLLDNLARFNRKERFHLLSGAFGLGTGGRELSKTFTSVVAQAAGISTAIPKDAFWAMDYHLDWIYAALFLAGQQIRLQAGRETQSNSAIPVFPRDGVLKISGTQEDIDFLIAYDDPAIENRTRMILIEAKFDSAWSRDQLASKAHRLGAIFGDPRNEWANLAVPYFVIASPNRPEKLDLSVLPEWARKSGAEQWFELASASGAMADMARVIRCDEKGADAKEGHFWKVG